MTVKGAIEAVKFAFDTVVAARYETIKRRRARLMEGLRSKGVEILTPPEEVLVSVVAPKEEAEEAAPAAAEAVAEPEVVGRAGAAPAAEGEAKAEGAARPEAKTQKPEAKPSSGDRPARSEKKE